MSSYRICSKCNTTYNHQIAFCFVDGEELHLSNHVIVSQDVPTKSRELQDSNSSNSSKNEGASPQNFEMYLSEAGFNDTTTNANDSLLGDDPDDITDWEISTQIPLDIEKEEQPDSHEEGIELGIDFLDEGIDTTVKTKVAGKPFSAQQPKSMSQQISLDLPPLSKELAEQTEFQFDDTTDIFVGNKQNQLDQDILDATQPIFTQHSERNFVQSFETQQLGEMGIDELIGLRQVQSTQLFTKQHSLKGTSSDNRNDFEDEPLSTEELPMPVVQNFALHNTEDFDIEEEEITNFEVSEISNQSLGMSNHKSSDLLPDIAKKQDSKKQDPKKQEPKKQPTDAKLKKHPETSSPRTVLHQNSLSKTINSRVGDDFSLDNFEENEQLQNTTELQPSSSSHSQKSSVLFPYIVSAIIFPIGLFMGYLIANQDGKQAMEPSPEVASNAQPTNVQDEENAHMSKPQKLVVGVKVKKDVDPTLETSKLEVQTTATLEHNDASDLGNAENQISENQIPENQIPENQISTPSEKTQLDDQEFTLQIVLEDALRTNTSDSATLYRNTCNLEENILWSSQNSEREILVSGGSHTFCVSDGGVDTTITHDISQDVKLVFTSPKPVMSNVE